MKQVKIIGEVSFQPSEDVTCIPPQLYSGVCRHTHWPEHRWLKERHFHRDSGSLPDIEIFFPGIHVPINYVSLGMAISQMMTDGSLGKKAGVSALTGNQLVNN